MFYFGNALGDAGVSDPTTFLVSGADEQSARNNPKSTLGTPALITDVNDFNRDGNVNTTDQQIPRNNTTNAITTALKFLNVGAGGPFAPESEVRDSDRMAVPSLAILAEPWRLSSSLAATVDSDASSNVAVDNGLAFAVGLRTAYFVLLTDSRELPTTSTGDVTDSTMRQATAPIASANATDAAFETSDGGWAPLRAIEEDLLIALSIE